MSRCDESEHQSMVVERLATNTESRSPPVRPFRYLNIIVPSWLYDHVKAMAAESGLSLRSYLTGYLSEACVLSPECRFENLLVQPSRPATADRPTPGQQFQSAGRTTALAHTSR